ncbi:hypothetical protein CSHISOI_07863 [Colletotrichum shisoi]|uniref:Uncharacterized protein n=1 Tax=Colletotrichum shisoi TaxID=2078593 RepID=A0A5Q4BLQ4_9PEZI|nr:hypothetical protein CSHISOI_07863 [Colletotrichum shisoi]
MQFFNTIIVLASLAAAAPTASNMPAVRARQGTNLTINYPCGVNVLAVWNTGNFGSGDGGWAVSFSSANIVILILILICLQCEGENLNNLCESYQWKTSPPYWSVSLIPLCTSF